MAPKKFTYTPGTGGGKRTKELTAEAKKRKALMFRSGGKPGEDKFGNFGRDVKDVLSYKGTSPMSDSKRTSVADQRKQMASGLAAMQRDPNWRNAKTEKGDVVKYGVNWGQKPKERLRHTVKEIVGVDINNPNAKDIGLAAASVLPVGKIARLGKGVAEAAQAAKAAEKAAKAAKAGKAAKATKENPWAGKPTQISAMVNKQRRANLEKIAEKTGTPRPKIGAERPAATPKAEPAMSGPTIPPTKGVAVKTETSTNRGARGSAKREIPERYKSTGPTSGSVAPEAVKPFSEPKPKYQQFKVDGKYGDAEKAKFKKAVSDWNRKKNATEKKQAAAKEASGTNPENTPLQNMREDAARARSAAAGGDIPAAGRARGTKERAFQDKQRNKEANPLGTPTKDLMRGPEGSNPRTSPNMTPPSRVSVQPSKGTNPPARSRFKSQENYDKAYAKWKSKNTESLPKRSPNVAAAPEAPPSPFSQTPLRPVAPRPSAPKASVKQPSVKQPKTAETGAEGKAAVESNPKKPAAMKSPTKAGASKRKFGGNMKAPAKTKPEAPASKSPIERELDARRTRVSNQAAIGRELDARRARVAAAAKKPAIERELDARRARIAAAQGKTPSAAVSKPKMSRLKKGLIATGAIGAAGVALKMTRDSDVSPNDTKAKDVPPTNSAQATKDARHPSPDVWLDKYGRQISEAEFNRRKTWWTKAKAMNKAEFDKAYNAEVARRRKYTSGAGTKKFGAAATTVTMNKEVPKGVAPRIWNSMSESEKTRFQFKYKKNTRKAVFDLLKGKQTPNR